MLIVIALGGNALRLGASASAASQRASVRAAVRVLAPIAAKHQLVLGAQTDPMVGYMVEQELRALLPSDRPLATMLTMVEIDPDDPTFRDPTHRIGPAYTQSEADLASLEKGWTFKRDGQYWRRVVASPEPRRIVELRPIKWLLEQHTVVVAACCGGTPARPQEGAELCADENCVIDKDLASELLAGELHADLFVMLTDVDAVYSNWGRPTQAAIRRASPASLDAWTFDAGSIGPKVSAACRFATDSGRLAAIGTLPDLARIVAGEAGTTISVHERAIAFAPLARAAAGGRG